MRAGRIAGSTTTADRRERGRAAVDGSISKVLAKITRAELVVVDDIGMLPSGQAAAEAFYRLLDATYERRSLAVTSNIHIAIENITRAPARWRSRSRCQAPTAPTTSAAPPTLRR